ncbi:hypothetical protein [Nonomuraea sp. CA-141351]|uniref:hypothetical protein n=1 Tax=Nonomuraea sp. CA-141351 TaxID=3239996 RepID=UPI003D9037F2
MAGASNTFDGGAAATEITPANSGGSSGTPFASTSGLAYSSAEVHRGPLSATFAAGTTGSAGYTLSGTGTRWARCYAKPSESSFSLITLNLSGGVSFRIEIDRGQAGLSQFAPPFQTTYLHTAAFSPPSGWIRVELQAVNGSGTVAARLYANPESLVHTLELSGPVAVSGSWSGVAFGGSNSGTSPSWIDSVAWSDQGWIGPLLDDPVAARPVSGNAAAHRAAAW